MVSSFPTVVAGYVSTRLYASLGGQAWKQNILWTSVLFPSVLFGSLVLLNFFLIGANASGAVPFGTILSIVLLWVGISVPLTVAGSVYGLKKGPVSHPVRVNQIPRRESLMPEERSLTYCRRTPTSLTVCLQKYRLKYGISRPSRPP